MLTNLGYPLIDRDETRYAEIPREMLATGNWVLPQLNFQPYYDKPPLLYWLCAISFQLFGVSETSARLVPALASLATLASTMFFGSRIFGRRIGLTAGIVLMLSVGFAFTSRYLLLDGVLALFVSLSLFTAYESIARVKRGRGGASDRPHSSDPLLGHVRLGWWIVSGVFIGLAFLTKGPIAVVLWFPPVFAFAWLSDGHAKPRPWHYAVLAGVAATVAAPWFVLVHQHDPQFLIEFVYKHNVARFVGEFHPKPIWYFLPVLLIAGHPWSFLTIPYVKFLLGRGEASRGNRPPAIGYLLLWSVWCFVFFSISKCKLPTYLLPAAPAFALMIGHYLDQLMRQGDESTMYWFARFWSARTATATTCLAGVGFVVFVLFSTNQPTVALFGWAMLWVTMLMSSLLLMTDRHQVKIAWMTSSGVAFLLTVMVMHQMVPAYSRSLTLFGESSPLGEQLAIATQPAIATIEHEFAEVPFYLDRTNIANFAKLDDQRIEGFLIEHPTSLLIVDSQISLESIRDRVPPGCQLMGVGQRGPATIYRVTKLSAADQLAQRRTVVR